MAAADPPGTASPGGHPAQDWAGEATRLPGAPADALASSGAWTQPHTYKLSLLPGSPATKSCRRARSRSQSPSRGKQEPSRARSECLR